jgi:hypothetical protein
MQDAFEDEFGRRIVISRDTPRQYVMGDIPSLTSDPLRMWSRAKTWGDAKLLCETYNALSRASHPQLDLYEKELAAQQRVVTEATKRWETLSEQLSQVKAEMKGVMKAPRDHLPSADVITKKLKDSAVVATVFGLSDAAGFLTSLTLAASVCLRALLIAGWLRLARILPE